MSLCLHRWSTIKRWSSQATGVYHAIQRCRRCEVWIRRDIDLKTDKMVMVTTPYTELTRKTDSGLADSQPETNATGLNGSDNAAVNEKLESDQ